MLTLAGFRYEAEMVPVLAARSDVLLHRRSSSAFSALYEVPTATGVPDLVLARFDDQVIASREDAGLPPVLDATECAVLRAIAGQRLTSDEVSAALAMTVKHIARSVLPSLAARGYVSSVRGSWLCHRSLRPATSGLVAIEAKRTDWRRASHQARRYLNFANEAYIALDATVGHRVEPWADRLASTGIGVATAGADGSVEVLVRSGWSKPRTPWHAFLAGERCWDLHRREQPSGPTWPVFGRSLTAAAPPTAAGELVRS